MQLRHPFLHRHSSLVPAAILLLAAAVVIQSPAPLAAQYNGGYQQAVGGISIKSDGLIENASVDTLNKLGAERRG